MKKFVCLSALLFAALRLFCQTLSGTPIAPPDLVCSISRVGNEIVVRIINASTDSRGCARSTASVTIGGATQNLNVPELGPEGAFEKRYPISSSLLAGPFVVTVKADAARKITESNEQNNTTTVTLNQPDLEPVLVSGSLAVRTDASFLYFSIKNTGDGNAGSSTTRFSYHLANSQKQDILLPTPPIKAGQRIELKVSPNTCPSRPSSGDCYWDVQLDTGKTVKESDEGNNTASGSTQG